jgi:hypothetical protein
VVGRGQVSVSPVAPALPRRIASAAPVGDAATAPVSTTSDSAPVSAKVE